MATPSPSLSELGWNEARETAFAPHRAAGLEPARVAIQDKHHYVVLHSAGGVVARASGKLLHESRSSGETPRVGDWVAIARRDGEERAIIHAILPRRTKLSRKLPGRGTTEQVLVTNVDVAFVVQALDKSFNRRLLERFLLMVLDGGIQPAVVLNKVDLCDDPEAAIAEAKLCAVEAPIVAVCALTGKGMHGLRRLIQPGTTAVFIGTSGVGKSSLINALYGDEVQATTDVREQDHKGRHTTTWREMIALPSGGLVIDTPGMREFQLWMAGEGIHEAFPDIEQLAWQCRFRNCTHTTEKHCAVLAATADGTVTKDRYEGFLKLRRELEFLAEAHHRHEAISRRTDRRRQRSNEDGRWRLSEEDGA
jgi:ribosome biogenesis GTPase